jgi:Ca2+-binding EF-hand superfamily protein
MASFWLLLTLATAAQPGAAASDFVANGVIATVADKRDLVLLLDDGPLHLRVCLMIDGQSLKASRTAYIDRLIKTLDVDGDGKLTRSEAARSPLFRTKRRASANDFLQSLQSQAGVSRREVEQKVEVKASNLLSFRDIQSSKNDQEVFKLLDRDESGVLEVPELAVAVDLILSKDADGDQCVSFDEFLPPPPPRDPTQPVILRTGEAITQLARPADLIGEVANPLLLERLRRKYDTNRDGQLDAAEMSWPAERLEQLDANGNGKIDGVELAALVRMAPDAEMVIDLKPGPSAAGLIRVESTLGNRQDDCSRTDFARLAFAPATITFSHRNLDPQAAALDDAVRKFNMLDADANGYLSRDETAARLRFERELFELIDADGDDKIFADEMRDYVLALTEPAAASCRINVYDGGRGFFLALDANADGRVSEREKRQAATSLAKLERNGVPGIGKEEPTRHFHIEFARGSFQLFGPSEQPAAETPAFQRQQFAGPIWFQRMDRNNDGDLIWNEFLGPRWVFDQLDNDGDELLDAGEAAKWRPRPTP